MLGMFAAQSVFICGDVWISPAPQCPTIFGVKISFFHVAPRRSDPGLICEPAARRLRCWFKELRQKVADDRAGHSRANTGGRRSSPNNCIWRALLRDLQPRLPLWFTSCAELLSGFNAFFRFSRFNCSLAIHLVAYVSRFNFLESASACLRSVMSAKVSDRAVDPTWLRNGAIERLRSMGDPSLRWRVTSISICESLLAKSRKCHLFWRSFQEGGINFPTTSSCFQPNMRSAAFHTCTLRSKLKRSPPTAACCE